MKKVLVCEDDLVAVKVITLALGTHNIETVCVPDGLKALAQLRENTFDLIITDIHMPYHNGDDIVALVRKEQKKNTPIIMISSDAQEEVITLARKLGVNEFFKKPVRQGDLKNAIKKYL